jgi:hypothetical protein
VAGGTGAVLGAATEGVKALAPAVKEIAGESIPVRASQESGLANAAENVAPTKSLSKFDVNETQPAAKRVIGNVATEIKNAVNERMVSADSDAAIAKLRNTSSKAADLGDAADQIKAQSKPVFEKLDELTKNDEMKFSDWQKQERAAYRNGDIEKAKQAKAAQTDILNRFKDQFDPKDLENARANWRQASALQDVHDGLNTKSVVGPTPVELRPKGTPDPGYINGKAFSKQILAMSNDGTLEDAGLTPEHIQSLQDLGTLLEKSSNVHKLGKLWTLLEIGSGTGAAIAHPATAVPTLASAVPAYLASRGLGRVMTNPEFADGVVKILRGTQAVTPAIAAQVTNEVKNQ